MAEILAIFSICENFFGKFTPVSNIQVDDTFYHVYS